MMTEQEEREQIKTKIIEDIDFLKSKEIDIRASLRSYFSDIQTFSPIDIAFNTVKMNSYDYLDTGTIKDLRKYYTNFLNRFAIASRAFLNNSSNKNTQNELIESAKGFNEFTNSISTQNKPENINFVLKHDGGAGLSQEFTKIYRRIESLENKPDEIIKSLNDNLKQTEKLASNANELSRKSERTLEDILKFKQETIGQHDKLVTKLENTINQKISVLLSDQFLEKATILKTEAENKLGSFSLKPSKLKGFRGAIQILVFINMIALSFYLFQQDKIDFWHFLMLKLTIIIPLLLYVFFTLNEYTKAKKSYEEFDYKRIMAITLINNYKTLKGEFALEDDKALELIKVPFEKIFDNPVHSIYGDKSGDKNFDITQLEKVASILEKLKPKTQ